MAQLLPFSLLAPTTLSSIAAGNGELQAAFQALFLVLNKGQAQLAKVVNDFLGGSGTSYPTPTFIGQYFFNTGSNLPAWWDGTAWITPLTTSTLEVKEGTLSVSSVSTITLAGTGVALSSGGSDQATLTFTGSSYSGWEITDGTHEVSTVTTLVVSGGTVSGSGGVGTLTIAPETNFQVENEGTGYDVLDTGASTTGTAVLRSILAGAGITLSYSSDGTEIIISAIAYTPITSNGNTLTSNGNVITSEAA